MPPSSSNAQRSRVRPAMSRRTFGARGGVLGVRRGDGPPERGLGAASRCVPAKRSTPITILLVLCKSGAYHFRPDNIAAPHWILL